MQQRVKIIEPHHPHLGESAELTVSEEGTVTVHTIFGKDKFKVRLINCPHMVDSCFVGMDGIEIIEIKKER